MPFCASSKQALYVLLAVVLRATGVLRRSRGDIRKVLVSGYTGLGHFVLKTVLIKQIEEMFPGCTVTIVAGNSFGTEHVLTGYETLILKHDAHMMKRRKKYTATSKKL